MNITLPICKLTGKEKSLEELSKVDERYLNYRLLSDKEHKLRVEDIQTCYCEAEGKLNPNVPQEIKERISVARQLGAYSWFCWEFNTVSLFWSVSCIELVLRVRYSQEYKDKHLIEIPSSTGRNKITLANNPYDPSRGYFYGLPDADPSKTFSYLLKWAFNKKFLPKQIKIHMEILIDKYNSYFAHRRLPQLARKNGWVGNNATLDDIHEAWENLSSNEKEKYQADGATVLIKELPKFRNELAHPSQLNKLLIGPRQSIEAFYQLVEISNCLWK